MWQWSQCFLAVSRLFLYIFCHSMAIFLLKSAERKASFFAEGFFFIFSSHDDLSMGLTAVVKIPSFFADFTLHHHDAALNNAWKWKIDGSRMNFNYCNKARSKSIKGGGMKKKTCWKIIMFVSAFCEKERANFRNKKCPVGVKGHG